jgi:uncharacterized protein (TIGR03435 family)
MKQDWNCGRRAFCRRALLALAVAAAGLMSTNDMSAQAAAAPPTQTPPPAAAPAAAPNPKDIVDTWQGTLHAGRDLRTVVKITKNDKGGYKAVFYSIDQGGQPFPVDSIALDGSTVTMKLNMIGGSFEGKLSGDGKTIDGSWSQGPNPLPLVLTRATPETEWAIPVPPPPVPPMAKDADPNFEVATIKPSDPAQRGKNFGFRGTHFVTRNMNMNDMLSIAYGLHTKQIIGAPDWFGTDLFDVDGVPDAPGRPNLKQMGILLQKLLADRCALKLHHETRELSVYVITVASGGPKMTKSTAGPDDPQGFGFRGLGDLIVRNMSMKDFAMGMQSAVTDKPVVDHTGLTDRYDFALKWTPDDSQFAQFRTAVNITPPKSDDPNAPPSLYTAVQETLGLKIEATKAPDDVIVIDHVEKPSAN